MAVRQLINKFGTFVEIDEATDPELVTEFISSGYDDWDGKSEVPVQASELDFAEQLSESQLRIDSDTYRELIKRKDPLVPNAGLGKMTLNRDSGLKELSSEPDSFAAELEKRRIRRPDL